MEEIIFPRNVILYHRKTLLQKFLQEKDTSGPKIDLWTRINLVKKILAFMTQKIRTL